MTAARAVQDPEQAAYRGTRRASMPSSRSIVENSAAIVAERGVYDSDTNILNIDSPFLGDREQRHHRPNWSTPP
jgi:hypothetical protein